MLTRFLPVNLPVRLFPFAVHVTVPCLTVAPAGSGIVFQDRNNVPIFLSPEVLHENSIEKATKGYKSL
jgi:hypothetical protein